MTTGSLERHFARIGARAQIRSSTSAWRQSALTIDIRRDRHGEYYDIVQPQGLDTPTQVVDVKPDLRHLLLMSEQDDGKHKFLCGHDERHWFVAAVPERARVSSVQSAFEALKPAEVRVKESQLRVKPRLRNRRRNPAFVRQGEWFFVPTEQTQFVNPRLILHNEPITRGAGSKPHICEELYRYGGELIYVCSHFPSGLTESQLKNLFQRQPRHRNLNWTAMRRNPKVLVRGRVRHKDHKTITLDSWHRLLMNTEHESIAKQHVAFID